MRISLKSTSPINPTITKITAKVIATPSFIGSASGRGIHRALIRSASGRDDHETSAMARRAVLVITAMGATRRVHSSKEAAP